MRRNSCFITCNKSCSPLRTSWVYDHMSVTTLCENEICNCTNYDLKRSITVSLSITREDIRDHQRTMSGVSCPKYSVTYFFLFHLHVPAPQRMIPPSDLITGTFCVFMLPWWFIMSLSSFSNIITITSNCQTHSNTCNVTYRFHSCSSDDPHRVVLLPSCLSVVGFIGLCVESWWGRFESWSRSHWRNVDLI